jgi:hypothetical protein
MPRARAAASRHDLARVREPSAGYPALPRSANNRPDTITAVAVDDVYDAQRRHRALARIDLLDRERRAGRIDEAQYRVGREVEAVFERMGNLGGGGQWMDGDRIDAGSRVEIKTVIGIEQAVVVNSFLGWLVRQLGAYDTRLLWLVLGHGQSFADAALAFGRRGRRSWHYMADRFRDALTVLANAKAAKGKAR